MVYRIRIYGIVQGVGFRPTVYRVANELGLRGFVRNRGSYVEVVIDKGPDIFIDSLKKSLPSIARIDRVEVEEVEAEIGNKFEIRESEEAERFSLIPPDTAICDECLRELFTENNRRYLYPFISCTVCEARFSVIFALPYDRKHTSMREFEMCELCKKEYEDPRDRRFHAQTISCPRCGPQIFLFRNDRKKVESSDPIREFAKLIDEGNIGLIKSWGGMHAVSILDVEDEMRKRFYRPQKPFAVMVKSIDVAERYADIDESEKKILLSPQRPIVLLRKKPHVDVVSPGLPTIGIYLPYSAIHHLLFRYLDADAIIMTSANPPGVPTVIDNDEAFGLPVDYLLLHNRKIVNRVDDSVVKLWKGKTLFIRKSRGYAPDQTSIDFRGNILSLGAEENSSVAIVHNGMLYLSQVVTNISTLEGLEGLEHVVKNFISMLKLSHLDAIVIDRSPAYSYRKYAKELSENYSARLIEVQHHHAHALSLQFESREEELVALTFDGTGFGERIDNVIEMWGGEILKSSGGGFNRIASLEPIPLIGGERAIVEPARILFAIKEKYGLDLKLYEDSREEILRNMLRNERVYTTSFGRFLDALAIFFGVGHIRTYEGELAMKLEKLLMRGKKVYDFEPDVYSFGGRRVISLGSVFQELVRKSERKEDLAYSAVYAVLQKFIEIIRDLGFERFGFSGGVAYSWPINDIIEEIAGREGIKVLRHQRYSPGDNGISVGQAYGASIILEH